MILNLCSIVADLFKEEQLKWHKESITARYSRKRNKNEGDVLLIEDDGADVPIVDHVSTKKIVLDMIEDDDVNVPIVYLVPINRFLPLFYLRGTIFWANPY